MGQKQHPISSACSRTSLAVRKDGSWKKKKKKQPIALSFYTILNWDRINLCTNISLKTARNYSQMTHHLYIKTRTMSNLNPENILKWPNLWSERKKSPLKICFVIYSQYCIENLARLFHCQAKTLTYLQPNLCSVTDRIEHIYIPMTSVQPFPLAKTRTWAR